MSRDVHSCTHWLRFRNLPPHLESYTRVVNKDRRHLFMTLTLFMTSCPKSLSPFSFLARSGLSHWRTGCSSTPGNRILMQYVR